RSESRQIRIDVVEPAPTDPLRGGRSHSDPRTRDSQRFPSLPFPAVAVRLNGSHIAPKPESRVHRSVPSTSSTGEPVGAFPPPARNLSQGKLSVRAQTLRHVTHLGLRSSSKGSQLSP